MSGACALIFKALASKWIVEGGLASSSFQNFVRDRDWHRDARLDLGSL
jgi:hypothetical protein